MSSFSSSSFSLLSPRPPCSSRRASFNSGNRTSISTLRPNLNHRFCKLNNLSPTRRRIVCNNYSDDGDGDRSRPGERSESGLQLYSQIERLITETAKQSQGSWGASGRWSEVEGAWVLKPRNTKPTALVHFIGGIFVGAAPQLTYRFFLERLSEKGIFVVATPFASGFDHFRIADEAQFKFDRCVRALHETVDDLPIFGIGHSLGSLIHLLIGSRYAVPRNGNVLMAFNNKAEIAMKQLENLSPAIMKQAMPLVEQLPPLYMDLVNGREDFTPKPEETRRLLKSYYGVPRNLLIKFKDDTIDETPILARILSSESAISSSLDMSIRSIPGDHGLPLQQVFPDVPPAMANAVNQGSALLANLTTGTPFETVAKEVSSTFSADGGIVRAQNTELVEMLVDEIATWISSNSNPTRR